jgi:hypothetical protein
MRVLDKHPSAAYPRAARPAYLSSKGDNYGGSHVLDLLREATQDTGANHVRPAILELQIWTLPK